MVTVNDDLTDLSNKSLNSQLLGKMHIVELFKIHTGLSAG
jgi:hypothetical protein